MRICEVCGRTDEEYDIKGYKGMVLCRKHISQFSRHGKFLEKTIYNKNDFVICNDHAEIILLNKQCEEVGRALIDLDDVEKCKQYKWHTKAGQNTLYVIATISETSKIFLHRLVLGYCGNMDIDHINHKGLDNRKKNLKICSHSENLTNQHNYNNGVRKVLSGRYRATIVQNNKSLYIGTYNSEEEAIKYRKLKEKELFG